MFVDYLLLFKLNVFSLIKSKSTPSPLGVGNCARSLVVQSCNKNHGETEYIIAWCFILISDGIQIQI